MLASAIPSKFPTPFASGADAAHARAIPATTSTFGEASYLLGYPPETFVDPSAGGIPIDGRDENGILNAISAWAQWVQAGGAPVAYDGTFQSTIGGYPNGAVVASAVFAGMWWRSTADNNATNPDTGGANWVSAIPLGFDGGKLTYVSATQIKFTPWSGAYTVANGVLLPIPSGGVTSANTSVLVNNAVGNLAANTVYYVSNYWTGSAIALAFWQVGTYTRGPDTTARNIGTQVIFSSGTPISAHSLQGMVLTNGSGQFSAQIGQGLIGLLTWNNKSDIGTSTSQSSIFYGNTSFAELSTGLRVTFLIWNSENFTASVDGVHANSVSFGTDALQLAYDGGLTGSSSGGECASSPGLFVPFSSSYNGLVNEGSHYVTLFGVVTPGQNGEIGQGYTRFNTRG